MLRPSGEVQCGRCSQTAAHHCIMEPKLCGKCCRPRCAENAHSQRHSARGKRGRISKEGKWKNVWKHAHLQTVQMWQNVPLRRHMTESGTSFGSLRYTMMRTILQTLQKSHGEEKCMTIEVT